MTTMIDQISNTRNPIITQISSMRDSMIAGNKDMIKVTGTMRINFLTLKDTSSKIKHKNKLSQRKTMRKWNMSQRKKN